MSAYYIFLQAHSGIRWLTLLLAFAVVIKSLIGLFGSKEYLKPDNILAASFVGFMHLQLIFGLILYFISPIVKNARMDFGAAMGDSELRFWAVEHLVIMILAIAAAQLGRTISKKSENSGVKFKFQSIFFGVSLLLILLGIPWDRIG